MSAPHAVIGRFAPSPTGAMHMGNARTALLAWLHSRAANGRHLLRFEDLDVGRVRDWAYDVTRRDLEWLGLDWDEESLQSSQIARYEAAAAQLDTYGCTCTRKEIQQAIQDSAGAPHGEEPVYPGTCSSRPLSAGRTPALRWQVPDWTICVPDGLSRSVHCQHLRMQVGDFVLRRGDGVFAYHLAVVVDDAASGVTDIVRGEDLLPATPRQVALQRALGLPTPRYLHVPLMTGFRGERLAKRGGAPPLMALRERGEPPGRVLSALAASLGWRVPGEVSAVELLPLWQSFVTDAQT
ncbi:tRNA glutamyl-Q(34) synthetase GluQRS [Deinococcus deserti]|uniref:Glutamyl-Q tRNA(Asp) synthetase n=1 Tax=Deinococcus deserti (strain DSM 17065 / CIP 109153 / LMG 22923 / VCD115) TaxID=546414 RepID=C1CV67_DEIDV|nr:tRNA glutamyl-Q(34) synthetase GluQRS [Deinococcus deserti]ACO46084.1 putative glutamate--tRNA ligase (glutamyl-tRNA synthetase) [Deinococcus deserti VCD115]